MISEARLKCYVSDESIYLYYFGEFEIGRKYNSPLRRDPRPSFIIQQHQGSLLWTDFGLGKTVRPDAIGFVQVLKDMTRDEAVRTIWEDFMHKGVRVRRQPLSMNIGLPYELTSRDMQEFELDYWLRHCIEEPLLDRFNVKAVDALYRHGSKVLTSTKREPSYVYLFDKDIYKIYRPLSEDRFRGQGNGDIVEGYAQLPKSGRSLIISSSMKDTLVLTSLGYNACNPPGETNLRAVLARARELNARFNNIQILFDNDGPGIRSAYRLSGLTGWRPIFLPKEVAKDPADVVKKYGNRFVLSHILRRFAQ